MKNIKTIIVMGEAVTMERRICANHDCDRLFWVNRKARQSMCSIECWEVVYQKTWGKQKQPRARRPGDKPRKKTKKVFSKGFGRMMIAPRAAKSVSKGKVVMMRYSDRASEARPVRLKA